MSGLVLPFLTAFFFSVIATGFTAWTARRIGFIHKPKGDRWSSRPVAMGGGVAMVLAWAAGIYFWVGGAYPECTAAVLVMFALGLTDDLFTLSPGVKLAVEFVVAGAIVALGHRFPLGNEVLSMAVTFVWIIGIANATNLLDNMDGISSGTSSLALIALAAVGAALNPGDPMNTFAALGAGAATGFLVFNFSPARIYMGDSGSLALGTMVAVSALTRGSADSLSGFEVMLLAALVCWVPIFDTTLVTVSRLLEGRPVSLGGRDHTAHRLHGLGLSERRIAFALYGVTILTGGFACAVWTGFFRVFYAPFFAWLAATLALGYFFLKPRRGSNVK